MNIREDILRLLRKNARLTCEQIGERLAVPAEQVAAIIAAAEADGCIRGYHALVQDSAFAEQGVYALIEVCVETQRDGGYDPVARAVSRFSEVSDVMLVSGNYDLLLIVEGQTLQDVADFVHSKLASLSGVRQTRSHFMLRRYKQSAFLHQEDPHHERLRVTP